MKVTVSIKGIRPDSAMYEVDQVDLSISGEEAARHYGSEFEEASIEAQAKLLHQLGAALVAKMAIRQGITQRTSIMFRGDSWRIRNTFPQRENVSTAPSENSPKKSKDSK